MTIDLAPAALDLDEEWEDVAPFAAAPVPPALTAAEALAAHGHHVHLVADDVQCLTHFCTALPGA
ncbi:hypothetical protein [Streptomyces sp. TBY4]|uniref:hypothetical protein n=1 Tax=Streptomyces sp. TBY4 TaxID=2962030 RepID=UPI0020B742EF|nr:hypothetical protein [Streptomyces sp. TBY4]MCP3758184.1 hypothetical protein [Streptomyces sp. TBY4]